MNKPPAFQFYVKDWRSSPTVRQMTLTERGIYIELLAASWESDERGTLPLPLQKTSKMTGIELRVLRKFLGKYPGVFREFSGNLQNEKLVSHAKEKTKYHGAGSSASASATATTKEREERAIATKTVAKRATPLFEGFSLDAEMIAFANERGVDPKEEFDKFRDHHKAKGSVFKDWSAAFRTWVRNAVKFDRGGKDVQRAGREVPKSFDQIRVEANQATYERILERNGISITRTQQPLRGTTRRNDAIDVPREAPRLTYSKD